MIWTHEEMIRRLCAYGLELKDSDGFAHEWCSLIPALERAERSSIHASTVKTPAIFGERMEPQLPVDALKKDLADIHPASSSFKLLLYKVRNYEN
ncbi:hypothetical protein O181_005625 [Austropuccinia psidii MF-1]|uniref:Uncharacterized protein n=1 Tax=Austropuccinia psidii MF-1 TaxID=1389203 RepID=A0A9Q3GG11_9BASI|nr:hypothetical protein [Austropuccinia psidii MF-1]